MKELEKHITEYLDDNLMEGYGQILEILEKALEKDEKDIRHDLEHEMADSVSEARTALMLVKLRINNLLL
jgi:hypothetical protein